MSLLTTSVPLVLWQITKRAQAERLTEMRAHTHPLNLYSTGSKYQTQILIEICKVALKMKYSDGERDSSSVHATHFL
jgi:hypothetical protein